MKIIITLIVLIACLNSFASIDSLKLVLEQTEVVKLSNELKEKSFELFKIEDIFAESDVRPRCLCESYKLTFSKVEYVAGSSKKSIQVYSVNTTVFGTNLKVIINKEK